MHCLVTGGGGFLGRILVSSLRASGSRVDVLGRGVGPGILTADLTRGPPALPPDGYDVIYHAAGKAHVVPRSSEEGQAFFDVNLEGTHHLLSAVSGQRASPRALVLVSTVAVYGRESGELLDEETPREAADPYGLSKAQAEDAVREWGERNNVRIGIARLPLVAGPEVPGNLGAMVSAMERRRYLGIGDGSARRSVVNASDVATVLPVIAERGGTFHLTDGHHPTFAEIEAVIASVLERPLPRRIPVAVARAIATVGDVAERFTDRRIPLTRRGLVKMTSSLTFDDTRARTELGWMPTPVLERAFEWSAQPVRAARRSTLDRTGAGGAGQ